MCTTAESQNLHDYQPDRQCFLDDVICGLSKERKELPAKYFYDENGSRLFERICGLEEYYIPRLEDSIMRGNIGEMAELVGPEALVIEYGSGDCRKVRFLLDNLHRPVAYVPIDISREQLLQVAQSLDSIYAGLEVIPVCADFTGSFTLPVPKRRCKRILIYFPGSTIGNFEPAAARSFLASMVRVCGRGGALLIGVDLKKDPETLHRAYNDSQGVTAAFNLNLLRRINRELGSDFPLEAFQHYAFYNPKAGRVEMHLLSREEQSVRLNGTTIKFTQGESIWTESSYKFRIDDFRDMAAAAGFRVERVWTDPQQWFSVQYLVTA